ncbi:MAG: hypothetical protein ACM3TR_01840 [Caulobacteraceae bacterium]
MENKVQKIRIKKEEFSSEENSKYIRFLKELMKLLLEDNGIKKT